MAENGKSSKTSMSYRQQETTYQSAQEAQVEFRFPTYSTGIVQLPPGSRGARSLYLKRNAGSFGFTLRHFIVYPPESVAENDGRHAAVGALLAPMDTIFVKHVAEGSSANKAGLQRGDRIVAVNQIPVTDKSYAQVVKLIQQSPEYLHLLVVPKEDDVLQQYFSETAYNPVSNQTPKTETQEDERSLLFQTQACNPSRRSYEIQSDSLSWRSLQNPHIYDNRLEIRSCGDQKSVDNPIYDIPIDARLHQDIYSEPVIHDSSQKPRAQPQVPIYRKMGRRASEGSTVSGYELYGATSDYTNVIGDTDDMVISTTKMKSVSKTASVPEQTQSSDMPTISYPNSAGCRLSLEGGRRESSSSLTSSLADGSKDSLSSYDSASTLTGQETDDSIIMTRFRKSFQQKEEFLRRPSNTIESTLIPKEFYSRPKKLEKPVWPPNDPRHESPSKPIKPTHQHFQRVKNDLYNERDISSNTQNGLVSGDANQPVFVTGGVVNNVPQQKGAKSPKDWGFMTNLDRIYEASPAPNSIKYNEQNGSTSLPEYADDRRYPPNFQIVSKRARQFESGRPLPEDDPISNDRTSFYKSELARLSSKKAVPNVAVRTREFETRSSEPRREGSSSSANSSLLKRNHRDSRSLESSASNASSGSINDILGLKLSGNVMIPSGSKYIHCPPPSDYKEPADISLENHVPRTRDRSNSASSWIALYSDSLKDDEKLRNKIQKQDVPFLGKNAKDQTQQEVMDTTHLSCSELPPLIPESVEHMHIPPSLTITPSPKTIAVRPTQLDLNSMMRPARHLRPPPSPVDSPTIRSVSPGNEDNDNKPLVVRRIKNTNIADEERAMRRESYLKATEGGRVHFDSDLSDGDVSPQILRSAHRRWRPPLFPGDIQQLRKLFEDAASSLGGSLSGGSSSSASLDKEKDPSSPSEKEIIKEGILHCKITEIDGKRSADRSWRQVWAVLKGPKLFLYKDRHHQSPVGTSDIAEQSLSNGVDMRASVVRVAEDYTKRKHVLRVSSVAPCRSEFLLQAENTVDLADWVKALQEQVAANTDSESRLDSLSNNAKQKAVPQTIPAQTTIHVQGSSLSLQPVPTKQQASRNRSPTGQSPVCKTRKPPSQVNEGCTSPKSKTWRGRVAKQFRKIHQGASSPSSPTAPEGSTFGVPIDQCIPSLKNQHVPKFVETCTRIVDDRGLNVIGIYRVPGNNASVTALTEEVNRNYEDVPQDDPRWNDLHVVGSLLKSFFRKMPDSLVTNALYTNFIKADKIEDPRARLEEIKRLVRSLPPHNYHTLKHIILHLKNVVEHSEVNKMDAKNLAIVFGPTIVRPEEENMQTMVNNMNHQCKIVESLVCYADWFFADDDSCSTNLSLPPITMSLTSSEESESSCNQALLLDNISKYEATLKDQKEKNGALFSSIISAAQRKVKRKTKSGNTLNDSKEDTSASNCIKDLYVQFSPTDLKQMTTVDGKSNDIPTTVIEIEKSNKPTEKVPWFNYQTDKDDFHKRVENFELETKAMLKMPRKSEIFVNSSGPRPTATLSSSAGNVNQNARLSTQSTPEESSHLLMKTHSASNVFTRTMNVPNDTAKNNLDNAKDGLFSVQYSNKNTNLNHNHSDFSSLNYNNKEQYLNSDNKTNGQLESANSGLLTSFSDVNSLDYDRFVLRRGSSFENINTSSVDVNANASLKKIKYENENLCQRAGSLDSLNKLQTNLDDGADLVTTMTKLYDEKLKKKDTNPSILMGEGFPFADESPEKVPSSSPHCNKENIPQSQEQRYRNPSLHKSLYSAKSPRQKFEDISLKEAKKEILEKDEDSSENVPDNERHISLSYNNKINNNSKLKRSESLNKPERIVSSSNNKLRRSESLNKPSDKLKRSDSLTKNEKTESNISKKREFSVSTRRSKEMKLKRKNGMPDRSIKRRHTVGGTKDPDKVNWLDNKYQEELTSCKDNCKEKSTRTSSPDLSSMRRERLFLEVNLIGPENMVVALRQHLIGARPQSFPDTTAFKVPLESHV